MTLNSTAGSVAAVVRRGDGFEAFHRASVAVVDARGRLSHCFGDPHLVSMARSAIKPFQALPLIESGAADALGIESEELAVACGSHSGTDTHVRVVERLLARAGASAADLQCGAHLPIDWRVHGRALLGAEDKDPLRNACSGKHAGFLVVARTLGDPLSAYLKPESQGQMRVRSALARACGVSEDSLPCGIDGCSAPNYALSLIALARGILGLWHADAAASEPLDARGRIRQAMLDHPLLVSGERRFDYDLMRAFPGAVVCKSGAEGLSLVAFREPSLAFAIKIEDGADRALPPVCVAVIEQLGLVSAELPDPLLRHRNPALTNHRRLKTGEITATLKLIPSQ